jgi:hypothetical protein
MEYEVTTLSSMEYEHNTTIMTSPPEPWHYLIKYYVSPLIIVVGICGNIFSCLIFATCAMRSTAAGHYIIALSVADSLVLLTELYMEVDFRVWKNIDKNELGCKLVYYLRYSWKLMSSWLVVAVAFERFILLVFPLKQKLISSTMAAKVTIVVIIILSHILCLYAWFTIGINKRKQCNYIEGKKVTWPLSDTLISVGLGEVFSSVVIFAMTLKTIQALRIAARNRAALVAASGPQAVDQTNKTKHQVTIMLMTVAIFFVILRVPYTIVWFVAFGYTMKQREIPNLKPPPALHAGYTNFYVIAISNHAINFFFYCITGTQVRNRILKMLKFRK